MRKFIEKYHFKPKLIINLEPTSLKMLNGCRGVTEFTFEVHGKSCHAGTKHLGVNALEKAVEIFDILQNNISKFDNETGSNSLNLAYLNGGVLKTDNTVSYSGNVVPNYAYCVGEIRLANKGITEKWIEKEIIRIGKQVGTKCDNVKFKFLMKSAYTPKEKLIKFEEALKLNGLKPEYKNLNSTGYFEVQLLQEAWGADLVVFGPGPSTMAHQVNEYVELSTVNKTQRIIFSFLEVIGVR